MGQMMDNIEDMYSLEDGKQLQGGKANEHKNNKTNNKRWIRGYS